MGGVLGGLNECVNRFGGTAILALVFVVNRTVVRAFVPFVATGLIGRVGTNASVTRVLGVKMFLVITTTLSLSYNTVTKIAYSQTSANFTHGLEQKVLRGMRGCAFRGVSGFSSSSLIAEVAASIAGIRVTFVVVVEATVEDPLVLVFSVSVTCCVNKTLTATFIVTIPILTLNLCLVDQGTVPTFEDIFEGCSHLGRSVRRGTVTVHAIGNFTHRSCRGGGFGNTTSGVYTSFAGTRHVITLGAPLVRLYVGFGSIFVLLVNSGVTVRAVNGAISIKRVSTVLACNIRVLVSLVVLSVVCIVLAVSTRSTGEVYRILSRTPAVARGRGPMATIGSNSVSFRKIGFGCFGSTGLCSLSNVSLRVGSNVAIKVVNKANSNGSSLIRLVPHLCSAASKAVGIKKVSIHSCRVGALHSSISVILRGGLLFSNAVGRGLY